MSDSWHNIDTFSTETNPEDLNEFWNLVSIWCTHSFKTYCLNSKSEAGFITESDLNNWEDYI